MLLFLPVDPSQLLMEAPCKARSQGPNQLRNIQVKRNIFFKICIFYQAYFY